MQPTSSARFERARTAVIEVAIDVARDPEAVFDYCSDPRHELEWNPQLRAVRKVGEGQVGLGARYEMVFPLRREPVLAECVEWTRPTTWRVTSAAIGLGLASSFSGRVSPAPAGSRLEIRMELSARGPVRLALPFVRSHMRRSLERDIRLIKAKLEGTLPSGCDGGS